MNERAEGSGRVTLLVIAAAILGASLLKFAVLGV